MAQTDAMTITTDEVRRIRADLQLSQAQFAARLNQIDPNLRVNRQTVYRWEGGTPAQTPGPHAEQAIRTAAPGERPYGAIDRHQLAAMIREQGVMAVARTVGDFASQVVPAIMDGVSFEGWSVMQGGGAIVFGRRDKRPQALDPEVLALRAEKQRIESQARNRFFSVPTIRDTTTREQAVESAGHRIGAINRRLDEIDPAAIARRLMDYQRMDASDWRDEQIAIWQAKLDAVRPAPNPPVEGVLCINDDDRARYVDQIEGAGFPLIVLMRDEAGFAR